MMGDIIKYYRKLRGITQGELARRVGTTKQCISKYEHGIVENMPRKRLLDIAYELNVEPAVLYGLNIAEIDEAERLRDKLRQRPALMNLVQEAERLSDDDLQAIIRIVHSMRRR